MFYSASLKPLNKAVDAEAESSLLRAQSRTNEGQIPL